MTDLRTISGRHRGKTHGPITRLISPDELGRSLKPFVFLDYFNAEITPGFGFPMHPHSGIATLTWQPSTDVSYRDTTGKNGVLRAGGLEWMNAGGGAWHQGTLLGQGRAVGFQLWVPMPPDVEDGPSFGQYIPPEDVPSVVIPGGDVKVLLGQLPTIGQTRESSIVSYQDINYLVVSLEKGATWRYEPPASHDIAWVFGFAGNPTIQGALCAGDLVVRDGAGAMIAAAPDGAAQMLIGTASRHRHALVLGPSSIHTNEASLVAALNRIRLIGEQIGKT